MAENQLATGGAPAPSAAQRPAFRVNTVHGQVLANIVQSQSQNSTLGRPTSSISVAQVSGVADS